MRLLVRAGDHHLRFTEVSLRLVWHAPRRHSRALPDSADLM
jgi:hypothetical protein